MTDLATECALLREAQMMRIYRPASANQTRLFSHELHVIPVGARDRADRTCRCFPSGTCGWILVPVPHFARTSYSILEIVTAVDAIEAQRPEPLPDPIRDEIAFASSIGRRIISGWTRAGHTGLPNVSSYDT
jgi:hypothetical protein